MTKQVYAPRFETAKILTLPVLQLTVDKEYFINILEPMFKGKQMLDKATGKPKINAQSGKPEEPVDLLNIRHYDPETGTETEAQIVVPTVLRGVLNESYADNAYVGKWFSITKLPIKGSGTNKYHPFSVLEVKES